MKDVETEAGNTRVDSTRVDSARVDSIHVDDAHVYIGVCLLMFEMPWVHSLKEKRALVKPVAEKLKNRFPVSVARLDGLNAHGWERVGMSAISNDPQWLEMTLNKASAFASSISECRVYEESLEIEHWA